MFLTENMFHHISSQIDSDGPEIKEICKDIEEWCEKASVGETAKYESPNWLVRAKLNEDNVEVTVGRARAVVGGAIVEPGTEFRKYVFPIS